MSNREDDEKKTPTRPSIKVSLPVELYFRRMRKLQEEARQDNVATKEKEKDKKVEEENSKATTSQTQKQTEQEQKPLPIGHKPPIKPMPGYLGIPVGSFEGPRQVQHENYPWSTGRSHPYRTQHHAARVQRAQNFRDYNNNVTGQQQERLMLGHPERPRFTINDPTTQYGPKFS